MQSISSHKSANFLSKPTQKPVVVLKFGGTTVGATGQEGRIKRARLVIAEYVEQGYYVVPVFSAYRRGRSGDQDKISITDELHNYRSTILSKESFTDGVELFRSRLWEPHYQLVQDLEVDGRPGLLATLKAEIDKLVHVAGTSCQAAEQVPSLTAYVMTGGERLSTMILAAYFNQKHEAGDFPAMARAVTGLTAGVVTDASFLQAEIQWNVAANYAREILVGKYLDHGVMPVMTGFDGIYDPHDHFQRLMREDRPIDIEERYHDVFRTCLGRGGSDLTATFLGMALDAEFVGFAKETQGVLTGDDMVVGSTAKTVQSLSFDLAMEAGNIYSKAVAPVRASNTPVHIFDPRDPSVYTEVSDIQLPEAMYLIPHPEACMNVHIGSIPDEPGALIHILGRFSELGLGVAEVFHHKSGTDCVVQGSEAKVDEAILALQSDGHTTRISHVWYVRVVGNLNAELAESFAAFVHKRHAIASSGYQYGSRAVTATFVRNQAGSVEKERARMHALVKEIHDELILPSITRAEAQEAAQSTLSISA